MTYPWAAGEVLTAADLNSAMGLVFIKSQTVGSGVSSVTVTDAFSSTFDNYRVIFSGSVASAGVSLQLQIGGFTTGYYGALSKLTFAGTSNTVLSNNASALDVGSIGTIAGENSIAVEVYNPTATTRHAFTSLGHGNAEYSVGAGQQVTGSAATSLTFLPASGTMTGGTIRVYGYNNG